MSKAILLDTHILLWLRAQPAFLTEGERRLINEAQVRYVSAASLWEIAILVSLGRIPEDERLFGLPQGLELLPIVSHHCKALTALPHIHRDPFDRMLIAQAKSDDLLLLTRDTKIVSYGRAGANIAVL